MSSTFGALNRSSSGLAAAQRALDVTGQNVANANTVGYSRQRVDFTSVGGSTVPAVFSTSDAVGDGVNADAVTRVRDAFLESRAQVEHGKSAQLTAEDDTYTSLQQAFREPGDTGLQAQLTDMWSAWHDVASSKGATAASSALLETTQTLVDGLNSTAAVLDGQWTETLSDLQSLVSGVNAAATNIAQLNKAISQATASGQSTNELLDQRDTLVLQLSEQIGATSQTRDDGTVDVAVGGVSLVHGSTTTALSVAGSGDPADDRATPATSDPAYLVTGRPRIVTSVGGTAVAAGGTAGGQLNALTTIIPGYHDQLDVLAGSLATAINGQQAEGFDTSGTAGADLLGTATGTGTVTAASIRLLTKDPAKLAASSVGKDSAGNAASDGGNADAMGQLGSGATSVDTAYRAMITTLGVQAATVSRNLEIQSTVTTTVDTDRESVSGVSTDEEMANMLQFQNTYSASARMISAIDQALDTLINHMGLVGNV